MPCTISLKRDMAGNLIPPESILYAAREAYRSWSVKQISLAKLKGFLKSVICGSKIAMFFSLTRQRHPCKIDSSATFL